MRQRRWRRPVWGNLENYPVMAGVTLLFCKEVSLSSL